jgi:hypothetical protein|tara:strand:+ start:2038 stop:2406 length:369 start_codon:yes stop_codon:yes gene_type:complete
MNKTLILLACLLMLPSCLPYDMSSEETHLSVTYGNSGNEAELTNIALFCKKPYQKGLTRANPTYCSGHCCVWEHISEYSWSEEVWCVDKVLSSSKNEKMYHSDGPEPYECLWHLKKYVTHTH